MNMNFPLILLVLVLVSGVLALISRVMHGSKKGHDELVLPAWAEYSRSFFPILLIVFGLRSFLVEPFRIPSGSLEPTLLVGDFILVNKFTYGLRLPVANVTMLNTGHPKTGEIMVFRYPPNPSLDFIKRVVGTPGDHVVYKDKVLTINGKEMSQISLGNGIDPVVVGELLPRPLIHIL